MAKDSDSDEGSRPEGSVEDSEEISNVMMTSDEVNYLVYRYLQESGFVHSAFSFAHESMLGRTGLRANDKALPPGALITFLQKGLQYVGIEETMQISATQEPQHFSLLSQPTLQAISRKNPPIQLNVPPAAAAAAVRARLEAQTTLSHPTSLMARQALAAQAAAAGMTQLAPNNLIATMVPPPQDANIVSAVAGQKRPATSSNAKNKSSIKKPRKDQATPVKQAANGGPHINGDTKATSLVTVDDSATNVDESDVQKLSMHSSEVFMCAWNPVDTRVIATGSGDASARIWEMGGLHAKDGLATVKLLPHDGSSDKKNKDVTTLEWSSDGKQLATGSYDGVARVWDGATGQLLHTLRGHHGPIFSLKWNTSGNYLLSGSYDKTTIVWDVSAATGFVKQQFAHHDAPALDVDWKDDTTFASCSTDKTVHICRVGATQPLRIFRGHTDEVNAVKWDPSGRYLASCSDDCTAKVWDSEADGSGLLYDLKSHRQEIYTVKWAPAGPGSNNPDKKVLVATASFDGTVRLWNMEDGTCYRVFDRHVDSVYSVAFSPSGDYLASGSLAGVMYIWNIEEGEHVESYHGKGDIFEVSWNKEETRVAACFSSNIVAVVDFKKSQMLKS